MTSPWPNTGGPNCWFHGATTFLQLIKDNQGFWCADADLKYLNVRLDTRNDRFRLYVDNRVEVTADRVVEAITKWQSMLRGKLRSPDRCKHPATTYDQINSYNNGYGEVRRCEGCGTTLIYDEHGNLVRT